MTPYETLGWIGTALILLAYFLNSTKRLESGGRSYQLMNLLGAIFTGVYVFTESAWPTFALQCAWGAIALLTLLCKNRK